MQARRMAGPEAASRKYDLITALGCHALASDRTDQRLILRFITLLTARYNWRLGLLSIGQREIARLWSVEERTVKREMAKLRAAGWLVLDQPARRGRVAVYAIDLAAIEAATRAAWPRVGPDFEDRMRAGTDRAASPVPANVVPFPQIAPAEPAPGESEWSQACAQLRQSEPAVFANWFQGLHRQGRQDSTLILRAPTAFHANYVRGKYADALARVLRGIDPSLTGISIVS